MNENTESLAKLRFEMQTVETELKARKKAFKKLERSTNEQLRDLEKDIRHHTGLINCQTESYNKYTGLIKETVEDLNSILRNMIAAAKGEAPDLTADLIEKLELKLLSKAREENAAIQDVWQENQRQSDLVPELAQKLHDTYEAQKAEAVEFSRNAEKRVKELEEVINRIRNASGHE